MLATPRHREVKYVHVGGQFVFMIYNREFAYLYAKEIFPFVYAFAFLE